MTSTRVFAFLAFFGMFLSFYLGLLLGFWILLLTFPLWFFVAAYWGGILNREEALRKAGVA